MTCWLSKLFQKYKNFIILRHELVGYFQFGALTQIIVEILYVFMTKFAKLFAINRQNNLEVNNSSGKRTNNYDIAFVCAHINFHEI